MIQPDPTPTPQQPAQPNAMGALLTMASTGDNWVKLSTLGLIALSGFGNWMATWNSSDRNKQEIEVSRRVTWEGEQRIREDVRKQINDMHNWMEEAKQEFHKGNEDSASNRRMLQRLADKLLPPNVEKNQ